MLGNLHPEHVGEGGGALAHTAWMYTAGDTRVLEGRSFLIHRTVEGAESTPPPRVPYGPLF